MPLKIITIFEIEMMEDQKKDLQKRICASNMTPSEYLAMITKSFDTFDPETISIGLDFLKKIKMELTNQKIIITEQWAIINELKQELATLRASKY